MENASCFMQCSLGGLDSQGITHRQRHHLPETDGHKQMEGQGDGHSRIIAGIHNLGLGDHHADQHDLYAPHHKCCGRRSAKRVGAGGDECSTHPACSIQTYWHPQGTQASPRQAKVDISSWTEQSQLQLQPASHANQPTLATAFLPDEPWARQ